MKHVISTEVLIVKKDDKGRVIKVQGIGNAIRATRAYDSKFENFITLKPGTIIGYTVEEQESNVTVLTLDKEDNSTVYSVNVDCADTDVIGSLRIFGMENILDEINNLEGGNDI